MHATVQQQGGRSPKPVNSPMSTSQLKHSPDSVQNSTTVYPSQPKGKKRERSDQSSEPVKRERSSKADDADYSLPRTESMLKFEIAKITEKGGLVNSEGVERLVYLMQPEKSEEKMELSCRSLLAGVIAATDKVDFLNQFVQLRGLRVLDEWLQEARKGKLGDSSSPRDQDRSVEDFLLVLLRALDRLPVNLNALQMCNIGKSVNHLRSHRNSEIQKKARSLVDTWKKRVEAEMNINDSKSGTSHAVSWPARTRNETSQIGNRHPSGSSDATIKNSISQLSSSKSAPVKLVQGDTVAKSPSTSASPGVVKLASSPASTSASIRDGHLRTSFISGSSELPQSATRDEKSSGSSQSHTNSQCSSDHAKNTGPSVKEDSRSSNSGSTSLNKSSGSASRHRKTANGLQGLAVSAVQKDGVSSRNSSLTRVSASEKLSQQPVTCEKAMDVPVSDNNNHKLIVKISNRGRSPAPSVNGGSVEDPSSTNSRASSPVLPEKLGQLDHSSKEKSDGLRNNAPSDVNTESWQSNDLKDVMAGCEEGDGSPAAGPDSERCPVSDEAGKSTDVTKVVSSIKSEIKSRKSHDSSLSSINALIESCAKCAEDNTPTAVGDDGMNLLASVAAGEISKSGVESPAQSPQRSAFLADESCRDYSNRSKPNGDVDASNGDKIRPSTAVTETQKQNVTPGDLGDRSRSSGMEMQNNVEACSKSDKKTEEAWATISASPATGAVTSEVAEQASESKTSVEDNNNVRTPNRREGIRSTEDKVNNVSLKERICVRPAEKTPLSSADVDENTNVNNGQKDQTISPPAPIASTTGRSMGDLGSESMNGKIVAAKEESQNEHPVASQVHGVSLEIKDKVKGSSLNDEFEKIAHKDAALCHPNDDDRKQVGQGLRSNTVLEQKSQAVTVKMDTITNEKPAMDSSATSLHLGAVSNDVKSEKAEGVAVCGLASQVGKRILDKDIDFSMPKKEGEPGVCGADVDLDRSRKDQNLENKDAAAQQRGISATQVSCTAVALPEAEVLSNAERDKLTSVNEESKENSLSATENVALSPASRGPDADTKLGFDLNEGFNVDEGRNGEPANSGSGPCPDIVCSVSPLQIPVCSTSCSLPASITVAAAAKGGFVPPDDLLWNKQELGWKGSAATSAFRPAEPRKSLPDSPAPRAARVPLDIDLNVADESSGQEFNVRNNPVCEPMTSASLRSSGGGLDLDLNKVDETSDMTHMGRHMTINAQRFDVSTQHVKPSTSNVYSNGAGSGKRDFDLNDGPAAEELPVEPIPSRQLNSGNIHLHSPFGPRINSSDMGNCFSWYPPGTSYSVSMTPSVLPDREAFSIVGIGGGPQRVVGGPTTPLSFNPDAYSGSVLSSSPALPFHPGPFQYPVLPFGTSFPLPTSALAGGSSGYMDPTAGGRISAIPSQLVGNASAVSFQYPQAYVVSRPIPDTGNNSVVGSNHIWAGKQGLDLNSGPGVLDSEGRDESAPIVSRQVSTISPQSLAEEQARMYSMGGGHMKRKEPEGGWNIDKLNFKQSSWR